MSEPSVSTYARYFNLTKDYTSHNPINHIDALNSPCEDLGVSESVDEKCRELLELFKIAAREYVSLQHDDQLVVSQSVTRFLKSCTEHPIHDISQIYKQLLPDPHRLRKLKIELPLLTVGGGDPQKDARKIRRGIDPDILIEDICCDDDDEEHNEHSRDQGHHDGVELLSTSALSAELFEWASSQAEAAMKREKLEVNNYTIKYLQATLSRSIAPFELSQMLKDIYPSTARQHTETSFTITESDFEFDSEIEDTPTNADVKTDHRQDLHTLPQGNSRSFSQSDVVADEEQFVLSTQADQEMEDLFRQFTNHHSVDPISKASRDTSQELPRAKRRKLDHNGEDNSSSDPGPADSHSTVTGLEQFKLKTPVTEEYTRITLPEFDLAVMFSSNHKNEVISQIDVHPGEPPFHIPQMNETLHDTPFVHPTVLERYLASNRTISSSEKLLWKEPGIRLLDVGEDNESTLRVEDFDIEEEEQETFTSTISEQRQSSKSWVSIDEHRPRANSSHKMRDPKKPVSGQRLALQEIDAVKNVGSGQEQRSPRVERSNPFAAQIRKRSPCGLGFNSVKLEHNREDLLHNEMPQTQVRIKNESASRCVSVNTEDSRVLAKQCEPATLKSLVPLWKRSQYTPGDGKRSTNPTVDPLSTFLDLRGKFKSAQNKSRRGDLDEDPIQSTQNSVAQHCRSDETLVQSPRSADAQNKPEILPSIEPLNEPRTIIVNKALLQSKPLLVQFLERHDDSSLTLIYRDLDFSQFQGPDVVLDACTCLTITSLQSLNQRPLPGQKSLTSLSPMHDRISSLASHYSRIIILVHYSTLHEVEVNTMFSQGSFAAFCASLSHRLSGGDVQPYWLPCTNPASASAIVNAWIWRVIGQYAYRNSVCASSMSAATTNSILIQDETLWEIFLCRAGLNPLAAQLVIGSLKRPVVKQVGSSEDTSWGLRRLVVMGPQARIDMFGGLIGHEVVDRLNKVLSMDMK